MVYAELLPPCETKNFLLISRNLNPGATPALNSHQEYRALSQVKIMLKGKREKENPVLQGYVLQPSWLIFINTFLRTVWALK